jgi:ABC-2 type transport system ATP-binding protein/ribosome-dependent ATPase
MSTLAVIDGLVKSFGDVAALRGVDLEVRSGEVVGLLGANGAGKTTLIRCLLGLTPPDSGRVAVMGLPPGREVLRRVGYVPQGLGLYTDLTVAENLEFQRGVFGVEPPASISSLLPGVDQPVGRLSHGIQRRVAFAAALSHRPELLVLDEPTSGVGVLGRAGLWEIIRDASAEGVGVLVTTHHLEEAEQCDRLVMLAGGLVVAEGRLEDIIGSRIAVSVTGGEQARNMDMISAAGLVGSFAGTGIRVVGVGIERVVAVFENDTDLAIRELPATLQEAFVDLVTV